MEEKLMFPVTDRADRLFAAVYLTVGYGFIHMAMSSYGNWSLAVYTVFYAAVVLAYLYEKGVRPSAESWFWLAVMMALGIPYAFWTVMAFVQVLALMAAAAYWTLCASGRLLGGGRTSQWVFFDGWNALAAVPFLNFFCQARVLFTNPAKGAETEQGEQQKKENRAGGILLGILIAVPLLMIVLPLLAGADAGFERLAGNLVRYMERHFLITFIKILFAIPVSLYLFGLVFGGIHGRRTDTVKLDALTKAGNDVRRVPDAASCTALTVLCFVYALFIGLQGSYLFSAFQGTLPGDFTYAEYARRGFFELCRIGVWNLVFLSLAGIFSRTASREHKGLRILTALLSALTLLLLATAASKLAMYISVYGLTVNRIIPMVFMVWLALVFAAVIARQQKDFPMVRFCVMAGAVLFCLLCIFPVESWTQMYNAWARAQGMIM